MPTLQEIIEATTTPSLVEEWERMMEDHLRRYRELFRPRIQTGRLTTTTLNIRSGPDAVVDESAPVEFKTEYVMNPEPEPTLAELVDESIALDIETSTENFWRNPQTTSEPTVLTEQVFRDAFERFDQRYRVERIAPTYIRMQADAYRTIMWGYGSLGDVMVGQRVYFSRIHDELPALPVHQCKCARHKPKSHEQGALFR